MKIAVSILAYAKYKRYADFFFHLMKLKNAGINLIHIDIMDKKFIGHRAISLKQVKWTYQLGFNLRIHLMVNNPKKWIKRVNKFNPDSITFHYEAVNNVIKSESMISKNVGLAIDLNTQINEQPLSLIKKCESITLMSVKAGAGGQQFNPIVLDKIKVIKSGHYQGVIEVDGGINDQTIALIKSNADIVVVGSFLTNAQNIDYNYDRLQQELMHN